MKANVHINLYGRCKICHAEESMKANVHIYLYGRCKTCHAEERMKKIGSNRTLRKMSIDKEKNVERIPKPGEFYRHIENKLYQIIAVAEPTEKGEDLVIYQALYGSYRVLATPLSQFNRKVDHRHYLQAGQEYCFEPVKFWTEKRGVKSSFANEEDEEEFLDEEYRDEDDPNEDYDEETVQNEDYDDEAAQEEYDDEAAQEEEYDEETVQEDYIEEAYQEEEYSNKDVQDKNGGNQAAEPDGLWDGDADKERGSSEAVQWLERFLDAEGYEKQLEVLMQMRGKVGSRELASICLVLGIPVLAGDEDSQMANIKKHLETRMRYDTRRLR